MFSFFTVTLELENKKPRYFRNEASKNSIVLNFILQQLQIRFLQKSLCVIER